VIVSSSRGKEKRAITSVETCDRASTGGFGLKSVSTLEDTDLARCVPEGSQGMGLDNRFRPCIQVGADKMLNNRVSQKSTRRYPGSRERRTIGPLGVAMPRNDGHTPDKHSHKNEEEQRIAERSKESPRR
jgi:hypothetical protein